MASFNDIIESDKPVLIDFFDTWCGPCKAMGPILEDVSRQLGDKARVLKIDIDRNPQVANKLQIKSVPTIMLFKNGKVVWRQSGVVKAAELVKMVNQHI